MILLLFGFTGLDFWYCISKSVLHIGRRRYDNGNINTGIFFKPLFWLYYNTELIMGHANTFYNTTDQVTIQGLLQNGIERRKAEDRLFNTYSYFIKEGMRKHALVEDDAFDAYSDTVLSVIEQISNGHFEGRSSLKTFIYQVFHNKCVDLLRKKTTNKNSVHQTVSITDMLFYVSDAAKSVLQKLVEKNDYDFLRQKLNELGDTCRQLLLLSADRNSDKEIAVALEYKTADVVKTSRLRCLEKLRKLYTLNIKKDG
jgi:RNA polymerase sigma factor (sigma-70 family)